MERKFSRLARGGGGSLRKVITVKHAIAIYVSSVLGPSILVILGLAAKTAGAGSLLAWAFLALASKLSVRVHFFWARSTTPSPEESYLFAKGAFGHGVGSMTAWLFVAWAVLAAPVVALTRNLARKL